MAIDNIFPPVSSSIDPGDSFSFRVDDTYTTLTVEVQTAGGYEYAYDTSLGGAQAGYSVVVEDLGSRHEFRVQRTAGWNLSPFNIRVVENETGTEATTTSSYTLSAQTDFPQASDPYYNAFVPGTVTPGTGTGAVTGIGVWRLTTSTPTAQLVKWDTLTPALVSRIDFNDEREGGANVNGLLLDNVRTGDWLLFERATSPTTQYAYFEVTADPTYSSPETQFIGLTYRGGIGSWVVGQSLSVKHIKGGSGTAGLSIKTASWVFDTSETTTPSSGKFSFDSDAAPTKMYLNRVNQAGDNMSYAIEKWSGSRFNIIDLQNELLTLQFTAGTPVLAGSVYEIPFSYDAGSSGSFIDSREFYFDLVGVDNGAAAPTDELGFGIGYWIPLTGGSYTTPGAGGIGFDAPDMASTTEIYIHKRQYLDPSGVDHDSILSTLMAGDQIILSEKWDPTERAIFTLAADATYSDPYIRLSSVTHEDSSLNVWPGVEMGLAIVRQPGGAGGGATNGDFGSFEYDPSTSVFVDPGAGKFRLNNADPSLATFMCVNTSNLSGVSVAAKMPLLKVGDFFYLEQTDNPSIAISYRINAATIALTGCYLYTLTAQVSSTALITSGKDFSFSTTTTGPKFNNTAAAPTVNDDSSQGYAVGSHWFRTGAWGTGSLFVCTDPSVGAAVWLGCTKTSFAPTFGGRYINSLNNWVGHSLAYTYMDGVNATTTYGTGSVPVIGTMSILPAAPFDGIIRRISYTITAAATTQVGTASIFRQQTTNGSPTSTITQVGAGISLAVPAISNIYKVEEDLNIPISRGDKFFLASKATLNPTTTFLNATLLIEQS